MDRQVEPKMWLQGVRTGVCDAEKVSWQMSQCSMVSIVERKVSRDGSGWVGIVCCTGRG
jgi:hypothetical protein